MPPTPRPQPDFSAMSAFVLIGQLGLVVIVPVVGGAVAGAWLDARAGTGGLFVIGLLLLGLGGGLMAAWRIVMREIDRGGNAGD
jgi:F0F1-type ATP synthase assembly protein I